MCSATRRRTPRSGSRRPSGPCPGATLGRGRSAHVLLGHAPCGPVPSSAARSTPSSWRSGGRAASRGHVPPGDRSGDCPRVVSGTDGAGSARGCSQPAGAVLADHDQHRPDRDDLALGDEDLRDLAGRGRRDLDGRLVGLDLDERVVLGDLLALGDEPAGDLALGQPFAEIRQLELVGHGGGIYRGRPTQASGGTISTRRPPSTRQSETACSSPLSSAAVSRGT